MNRVRAIFAGGGTGGHLFPALAIADKLRARIAPAYQADFRFVGTKRGIEYKMRDKLGYPLHLMSVRGFRRSAILSNLLFPFFLFGALIKSIILILRFHPDIVIGTGGYVMGPVFLAATMLNISRVIQEQNSYPGITTRQLALKADKVFLGFADAKAHLKPGCNTVVTGNPIKEVIGTIPREEGLRHFKLSDAKKTILILGGSQGAMSINLNILDCLKDLPDGHQLIWQTGERGYRELVDLAGDRLQGHAVFPITDRIELAYAAADIAIARAGAITLAELEAAEVPAILIPFPFAAANHQCKNAELFEREGAAVVFGDEQLGRVDLLREAVELLNSGSQMLMQKAMRAMHRCQDKPAADRIVSEIMQLIGITGSDT
ncbi:MAG: undecaprenyldiphospho-muramoylpentapeptide beta-N-acetylglucosaminyltransferase [Candidatus Zixiibacteriota bacterium]|nr:MAG: undecaprenyldiphospho-muramoylpentapeptide beta-N-acetylglucosaminyltransferase [candidate division Zixibacteria bacterium]